MQNIKAARPSVPNVTFDNQHPSSDHTRSELLAGLGAVRKSVNPKFLYDQLGSELFDQITRLPEYYPSRTEMHILTRYRDEIAEHCGAECVVIEPGSGSSEKVRLLLDALAPAAYVPIDISADFLLEASLQLGNEFPWLRIHAICADFAHNWSLPAALPVGKRVVFYPGSTIGNMEPEAAQSFLLRLRQWIGNQQGGVLLGVDLHKSVDRLEAAYDDAAGVTARFNLNLLHHINATLNTDFDPDTFDHHAFYNAEHHRIEMHLVSKQAQSVRCNGTTIRFAEGESIHTENSYKYTLQGFEELAARAGFKLCRGWLDDEALFGVLYLEPCDRTP